MSDERLRAQAGEELDAADEGGQDRSRETAVTLDGPQSAWPSSCFFWLLVAFTALAFVSLLGRGAALDKVGSESFMAAAHVYYSIVVVPWYVLTRKEFSRERSASPSRELARIALIASVPALGWAGVGYASMVPVIPSPDWSPEPTGPLAPLVPQEYAVAGSIGVFWLVIVALWRLTRQREASP